MPGMLNQSSQKPLFDADLHNHTTYSDGEYSPAGLVAQAAHLGLKAVAVTDHDTLDGLPEALEAGVVHGVEVICGVEMTLRFVEPNFTGSLHLLAYFSKELFQNEAFRSQTRDVLAQGRGKSLTTARIEAINRCFSPGCDTPLLPRPLLEDDVYAHGHRISRRHFAQALNSMGITDKPTITRIIGNDSPAYLPSGVPLDTLKSYLAGWPIVKVLAHPAAGSFPGDSHYKEVLPPFHVIRELLPRFLDIGLDGLEIFYPGHTPEWSERLEALRIELGLPIGTGGSDCHDLTERPLGVSGVSYQVVENMKRLMSES